MDEGPGGGRHEILTQKKTFVLWEVFQNSAKNWVLE